MPDADLTSLSLEEKATLLSGASFWRTPVVEHAGIDAAVLTDGPHGVRLQREGGDRLGIGDSEPATAFPTAAALGSTWDPDLVRDVGEALGREARALGVDVLLGPGVNIKRSPLCGRNFEYFSEDPLLSGVLGSAWVRGLQSQGVGASVKHFAANNQETERMRVSAQVDERTLREIYLPAFEHVVREAHPATVMCSYNRINGVYASQHRWLLTDVLRTEWGFDGYVVSDWGAVRDRTAALAAGLDLEMPSSNGRGPARVVQAVRDGDLASSDIDRSLSRVLAVHERLRSSRSAAPDVDPASHHDLARRVAAAGSVLLRNEGGLLPLDRDALAADDGALVVLGELARTPRYQGAGSSHIVPTRLDDVLTALREALPGVGFEPGYRLDGDDDADLREQAVTAAREAGTAVVVLGLPDAEESEGFDRTHLDLPPTQLTLLREVAAVNDRVVVVLSNGSVVDLREIVALAPAVLEMWLGGQASGSAAAEMLLGDLEPGGRLAETIPLDLRDTPAYINWPGDSREVTYGERVYVGYRWYDTLDRPVLFPFGFGLGYTTFEIGEVDVVVGDGAASATVTATVTNSGERAGAEVVQVYVGAPESPVDRPTRELRAFAKVHLEPGARQQVTLELDERAFAYWDTATAGWVVQPGRYVVEVGRSSRDVVERVEILLDVPPVVPPLDADSTLDDWLRHPDGEPLLRPVLEEHGALDPALLVMIGSMPLPTVFAFNSADGDAAVRALLDRLPAAD